MSSIERCVLLQKQSEKHQQWYGSNYNHIQCSDSILMQKPQKKETTIFLNHLTTLTKPQLNRKECSFSQTKSFPWKKNPWYVLRNRDTGVTLSFK